MSVQNIDGFIRLTAAATITPGLLVKADGTLCVAATTKTHAGVAQEAAVSGGLVTLLNPAGKNLTVRAAVAIAVGDGIYYAAGGQVTNVPGTNPQLGTAIDAGTGAGSIIEVAFT